MLNERTVWEILPGENGKEEINKLKSEVPNDFAEWIDNVCSKLWRQFHQITLCCSGIVRCARESGCSERKQFAEEFLKFGSFLAPICFKMLDNQPHNALLWKMLKPAADKKFRNVEE